MEAEQEFERAMQLAPQDVRVWNGMFSLHLRNRNTNKARETLRDLERHVDLNLADRNFVIAQGYELLGDWDLATKQYEAAAEGARIGRWFMSGSQASISGVIQNKPQHR